MASLHDLLDGWREKKNERSLMLIFQILIGYLMSTFEIYFVGVSFIDLLIIFGATVAIGLLILFTSDFLIEKQNKKSFI